MFPGELFECFQDPTKVRRRPEAGAKSKLATCTLQKLILAGTLARMRKRFQTPGVQILNL